MYSFPYTYCPPFIWYRSQKFTTKRLKHFVCFCIQQKETKTVLDQTKSLYKFHFKISIQNKRRILYEPALSLVVQAPRNILQIFKITSVYAYLFALMSFHSLEYRYPFMEYNVFLHDSTPFYIHMKIFSGLIEYRLNFLQTYYRNNKFNEFYYCYNLKSNRILCSHKKSSNAIVFVEIFFITVKTIP